MLLLIFACTIPSPIVCWRRPSPCGIGLVWGLGPTAPAPRFTPSPCPRAVGHLGRALCCPRPSARCCRGAATARALVFYCAPLARLHRPTRARAAATIGQALAAHRLGGADVARAGRDRRGLDWRLRLGVQTLVAVAHGLPGPAVEPVPTCPAHLGAQRDLDRGPGNSFNMLDNRDGLLGGRGGPIAAAAAPRRRRCGAAARQQSTAVVRGGLAAGHRRFAIGLPVA